MQKGEFVNIKYSAKIKDSGEIFDQNENVAIIIGGGYVFKGLDEKLESLNVGEKKTIEIGPENGFGQRKTELIKTIPESEFSKMNKKPQPGMVITADNVYGKILSVSGGRVQVDFNHPLAGRTLVYDIEITKKIEDFKEKIKAITDFFMRGNKVEINTDGKNVEIITPPFVNIIAKKKVFDDISKYLGINTVKFVEIFEKK